jgi:hypothetical protein
MRSNVAAPRLLALLAATLAAATATGCGGGDGGGSTLPPPPPEHSDPAARLPAGWRTLVSSSAGFSIGVPPGWTTRAGGATTLVRSADGGLAVAISADRSDQGRAEPLAGYVRATIAGLSGYGRLSVGAPSRERGLRYQAAVLDAGGRFRRTGVRQAIRVVALRRADQVTYTLFFFRNASVAATRYAATVGALVRSFRGRAPAQPGG